ncbi:HEAT repeat domain-containing protein [Streptomyces peucetius]|uniref:HEAT repeat domain-containing protein n=1 Tax=Streptomyces peucetius TaxID=1950 RepID=A0ABY6ICE4_STRPE|nr:HEAT repeat domain-containing protein [Streptomyces peucetius]UYQ64536.1 HEAT repeat domain-containing protein [Streptomyces peucetius]
MEFLDLSPYEYRKFPLPMRSVGWLGRRFGVQGGGAQNVTVADMQRFKGASRRLGSVTLGTHECEFCPADLPFEGNGEYRYYCRSGEVYAAPSMILHYVDEHGYCPPREFLESLHKIDQLDWDWRAERLIAILRDDSEDFDFRCEAIIDLVHWKDPRVLRVLTDSVKDEELVDIAGDEIGRSLGILVACGFAGDLRVESLPGIVKLGFEQIVRK